MIKNYETPAITDLGEFSEVTGFGLGGAIELFWAIADFG